MSPPSSTAAVAGEPSSRVSPGWGRLTGVDMARAVAVLGMFAAHFNPGQLDPHDPLRAVVSGRSAVLFVVLAGVSLALSTGTARGRGPRPGAGRGVLARAAALFVLGLALTWLGTTVKEILTVYAVLFVLAVPLSRLGARTLTLLAAAWTVAGPVLSFVLRAGPLPPGPAGRTPDPAALGSPAGWLDALRGLLLDGPYPVPTWVPFLLVGMVLARTDLAAPAVARRMLLGGTAVAAAALAASWVALGPLGGWEALAAATGSDVDTVRGTAATPVGAVAAEHPLYLLTATPHSGTPVEIVASAAIAVAVLGGCLLLASRTPRAVAPLAATGRLALSAYTGHILLIAAIGLPGMITLLTDQGYGLLLATLLATPLLALGWTTWAGRGPLERLSGRIADTARSTVRQEKR